MSETENQEVEEVDVLSLLADTQGEEEQDEVVNDSEPTTYEEAMLALSKEREIKTKRNQSLKKSKQATHRVQEENDALLRRLDKVEERMVAQQPNQEAERLAQEAQDLKDRAIDNPDEMPAYMEYVNKQSEQRIANYIVKMQSSIDARLDGLQSTTDPERVKYQEQINTLKQKDGFSELDDATLFNVAKALTNAKVKTPRGAIGGQPARSMKPDEFELTDDELLAGGFPARG